MHSYLFHITAPGCVSGHSGYHRARLSLVLPVIMSIALKRFGSVWFWVGVIAMGMLPASLSSPAAEWPHPVPCRIQDGSNPDLFVMTLGDIETPIADGVFDPTKDEVRLKNGSIKTHYYRDELGIKFYQPLDKTRFPHAPSGWCTWYFYYTRINENEVMRNAEWIAANLKDYGAQYVQIDDGWQGTGAQGSARNWGDINTNRFPAGLAALARHIKSVGLTPGLWIAPHGQNNDDVVNGHPGVFLLKPDGTTASDTWEGRFLVDPTHPASSNYLRELFQRLSGWGYDYFKIDGQPIVVDEYREKKQFMHAPSDDAAGLYRKTVKIIRDAIGPNRYLLGCWGIPLEGAGIMNGSRTGGDIVLGWDGFQVALRPTLQFYFLHNIVWYADPDVLLVRAPLTLEQARVWATLQGLTGQALMSSDRLMDLGGERVELLRRVYPAADIRPLDLFPTERYKRIWDLKVNHLGRRYDVVGLFNFSTKQSSQIQLRWSDLGWSGEQPMHVYDFWNKEYLGCWAQGMAVSIAPTSCRVLTLLPAANDVQLISTSRHITQGPIDLLEWSRARQDNSIKGRSRVIKNDPYELSFSFPPGTNFVVSKAAARAGWKKLPVTVRNHQGWAVVTIQSDRTQEVAWEVQFQPSTNYDFPPSAPVGLVAQPDGLAGAILSWQEQYYLNSGYEVYLDGKLIGRTPEAKFTIGGLRPEVEHSAVVKTVWETGHASPASKELRFSVANLAPVEMPLWELEPVRSIGQWEGYEIDSMLQTRELSVAGRHYAHGLSTFADAEMEFEIHALFDRFSARVGVDDRSAAEVEVEFVLFGDGKEVARSGVLSKGQESRNISADISGVRRLILKSIRVSGKGRRAEVDWIAPELSKADARPRSATTN